MNRRNKLLMAAGMFATLCSFSTEEITVHANEDGYNFLRAGVSEELGLGAAGGEVDAKENTEAEEDGMGLELLAQEEETGYNFLNAGVAEDLGIGTREGEELTECDAGLIFGEGLELEEIQGAEIDLELEDLDSELGLESDEIQAFSTDLLSGKERIEQELAVQENEAGYDFLCAGAAEIFELGAFTYEEPVKEQAVLVETDIDEKFEAEKKRMSQELTMANVQNVLNVRAQADEDAEKVGLLYRDCGGTILERRDGWTKLKSGSVIGWAKDEYLLFGEEAKDMAEDVGNWIVTLDADAVRVRTEPSEDADVYGLLAYEDSVEFIDTVQDGWISVDYNGETGYVDSEYVNVRFHIDEGESMDVIKIREREEEERRRKAEEQKRKAEEQKRKVNLGAVSANADETRLLASLIYCEAGNQSYEGMVGVGAVVMNRVRSGAYPNTIHSVIYASGQFTPALTGSVARVYAGNVPDACMRAAQAAINGESTVGGATHFKRAGKREGYVLGDHVFW